MQKTFKLWKEGALLRRRRDVEPRGQGETRPGRRPLRGMSLLLAVLLLTAAVLGGGGSAPVKAAKSEDLGLTTAVLTAQTKSLAVAVADEQVDAAEEYYDFLLQMRRYEETPQAQMQIDQAKLGLALAKRAASFGATSAYYGAVMAGHVVEVRVEALELAKKQLEVAKAAYRAGTRARTDVLGAEVQLRQAEAEWNSSQKDYQVALLKLNQAMGEDPEKVWNLTSGLNTGPLPDTALDEAIEKARENNYSARMAYEEAEYYDDIGLAHAEDIAQKKARKARYDAEIEVRQTWLDMKDAYERIDVSRDQIHLAQEQLRLANLRYEAGVGTQLEVQSARLQLAQAKLAREQALFDYSIARARYDFLLDGGSTSDAGGAAGAQGGR